jgi:hypothetical protein
VGGLVVGGEVVVGYDYRYRLCIRFVISVWYLF